MFKIVLCLFIVFGFSAQSYADITPAEARNYLLEASYLDNTHLTFEILEQLAKVTGICGPEYWSGFTERVINGPSEDRNFSFSEKCLRHKDYFSLSKNELLRRLQKSQPAESGSMHYQTKISYRGRVSTEGIQRYGDKNCLFLANKIFNHWLIQQYWPPNGVAIDSNQSASTCQIKTDTYGVTVVDCMPWESAQFSFKDNMLTLKNADPIVDMHDGTYLRATWRLYVQPGSDDSLFELTTFIGSLNKKRENGACSIRTNVNVHAEPVWFY